MNLSALDLRPANASHPNAPGAPDSPTPPCSIEAEQALLGAVLYDAEAFHLVDGVDEAAFFEPFHGRLWAWAAHKIGKGVVADIVLAAEHFARDDAFQELGGITYLADLVDRAPPAANAPDYGRLVADLALRRELLRMSSDLALAARDGETGAVALDLAEAALLALRTTDRKTTLVSAGSASAQVLADLDAPPESIVGIHTGFAPLDEELGPLMAGDLVLMAARPSMGKSATSECIALNIARTGRGVIQINVEMDPRQMAQRHLTDICFDHFGSRGPEYRDIRRRRISYDQRRMLQRAHEELEALPVVMLRKAGITFSKLRSLVRRQAALWAKSGIELGAVIIDHMGRVRTDEPVRDLYSAQAMISASSKELADEIGCPLFALVQLNRETEKRDEKRPLLGDIRQSGTWEEDADYVIGFYREAYYAQRRPEPKGDLEWSDWDRARKSRDIEAIILKARGGACLTVKLWGDVARNAIRGEAPPGSLFDE